MAWFNITRNLTDLGESAVGWLPTQDNLWVITSVSVDDTTRLRLREANAAAGEGYLNTWALAYTDLPVSNDYDIQNSVEDTENSRLFISNTATGEVYYNDSGDPADAWGTVLSTRYGNYVEKDAKIRQLAYYNKQVFIAHRGGVSTLNYAGGNSAWTLVGDFTEGFEGVGECYGFYVLNNELYVTVAFGNLGVVYKYNIDVTTITSWIKVAEFPAVSTNPQYLTAHNNTLFVSDGGVNRNIFNSKGIDTTLTGQPRFTQGIHLTGVPSDMITHSEDNNIYVTCSNEGYTDISDTYTDNLIKKIMQISPYSAEPDETFFTGFIPEALSDYTVSSLENGGNFFSSVRDNPNLSIKFKVTSNALKLLPGETYTIVFEYGFHASAKSTALEARREGSSLLEVGFKSNAGTGIDAYSPGEDFTFNDGLLFTLESSKKTRRTTFTFNADDLAATTDGEFVIEGSVAAAVKGAQSWRGGSWTFLGSALIKNIKLFRGNAEVTNAEYVPAEYIVKEYSDIASTEQERHSIERPSPPDQWFIKFGRTSGYRIDSDRFTGPSGVPSIKYGDTFTYRGDLKDTNTGDDTNTKDDADTGDDTNTGDDADTWTSTTVNKLSRGLITNRMKLSPNSIYRMHVLISREDSDSGKPLKVKVTPSINKLAGYTGTITSIGTQSEIVWEFDTSSISNSKLDAVRFKIEAYEENIQPSEGGTIYISDVNLLGTVRKLPVNTVYRYDGKVWDNSLTKLSNDGGIIGSHPHKLVQHYEENSSQVRLYCLSGGEVYVWSIAEDPYGRDVVSRIITVW